ncbi:GlxA family transcriptional regulator [Alkalimarinus coralli]|uniref:GlxA family transcriptional regulator n=1 Tax=Alkalimarinus coralli TaxID=2935863 RepID=UPI00202B20C2|nr:GlxA family transcriptional regulator [Alkalimarinus coralli]
MKCSSIVFLVFPGFELLDLSGPASVFSNANELHKGEPYEVTVASVRGGLIESGSSIAIQTIAVDQVAVGTSTTILVVGGDQPALMAAAKDSSTLAWLKKASGQAGRFGSICTGAFILAAANLLEGKSCTTHWAATQFLKAMQPKVNVLAESLYVIDDKLWTSAGVTTGLDMALEMLRQDLGNTLMARVAQRLVVYAHRPGNQSQFSNLLELQSKSDRRYSNLLAWIDDNIDQAINVSEMADYMCMTERTFYRKFTAAFNLTPSKYLEEARLNRAKLLLEQTISVKKVSEAVGFKSESAFRTRFESRFGLSPSMYRRLHKNPWCN